MELLGLGIADMGIRFILGLSIGFCIGLTGVGGGVLVLPSLTVILGLDPIIAVGTTTLYAFLTKITAAIHHLKLKTVDWKIVCPMLAGAVPANIFTAFWVSRQAGDPAFKQSLKTFIVYVVFFSVGVMVLNMITRARPKVVRKERTLAEHINGTPALRNSLAALIGVICGGLIGATSIGGGVLIVPLLIILFALPASRTVGSSILIAFVLTLTTSIIYGSRGEQDIPTAAVMAVGSLAGVYHGSRLSVKMPEKLLRLVVVILVLAAALLMLFGGSGHG